MGSERVVIVMLAAALLLASLSAPVAAVERDRTAGAAGAAAAAASAVADHLPSGPGTFTAAAGQGAQRTSVTEILASVRGHRDLDAWLGAMADAIKATSGIDVATASAPAAEDESSEEPPLPYSGTFAETYDAGDLNGDGASDVVTYHWDVQTWQAVLEARRGDTGAVLWERSADADGGLAWPLGQDLTGNGSADLLVYDLEILTDSWEDCDWDADCWEQPWEATFRWTIGLLDGSAAEAVWSRSLNGWVRESYEEDDQSPAPVVSTGEFAYAIEGVNLHVIPFLGDLDGDSRSDVILNEIDLTERLEGTSTSAWTPLGGAGTWEGAYDLRSTTRTSVIASGGAPAPVLVEEATGQVALVWPIVHPDGTTDLVRERTLVPSWRQECAYAYVAWVGEDVCPVGDQDGGPALEVTLLDGRNLAERWSTSIDGWGAAWPLGGDLDGDGQGDIGAWRLDPQTWESDTQLLSGASGERLWDDDVSIRDVLAVGPLNDDAGDDVIAIDYDETYSEVDGSSTFTLYLQRRDGRTGKLLAETVHTADSGPTEAGFVWTWLYVTSGDDGNGDARLDLTAGTVSLVVDDDEDERSMQDGGSRAVAESGATGESLYTVESPETLYLFLADDFDGDGLTEVVEEVVVAEGDEWQEWTVTFTPRRLTDAAALWRDESRGSYVFHTWGGDADGNGSGEVYRHVDSMDARRRFSTVVTALDARTGAARWNLHSRP